MIKATSWPLLILLLLSLSLAFAQEDLDFANDKEFQELLNEFPEEAGDVGAMDDLESLKDDIGEVQFNLPEDQSEQELNAKEIKELTDKNPNSFPNRPSETKQNAKANGPKLRIIENSDGSKESAMIFDVGKAEKELLDLAEKMQGKIPNSEWNEIAGKSTTGTYEVVSGDWLWKISQRIFGSGFYYSKIWALNPYITNPHEIEPGMILSFSTGSDNQLPSIDINKFENLSEKTKSKYLGKYDKWGDDAKPEWLNERERLRKEGVYLQYGTSETTKDLDAIGDQILIKEYEVYEPPALDFAIAVPETEFDESGFDRNAKINFNFKEGLNFNTFVSNNVIQDFGKIDSSYMYKGIFSSYDRFFVRFDENMNIVVGDKFSVYGAHGKATHKNSDREGFKYDIKGSFKTIQKHEDNLWECEMIESTAVVERGDRVTIYTPKIEMLTKTYNTQTIEAVVIAGVHPMQSIASYGDVIFLDRGRADGVEVGNVFEVYGFKDNLTKENITDNPTYKKGELTSIIVTDNFTTAIVTNSSFDISIGDISVTKTADAAARVTSIRNKLRSGKAQRLADQALDELDVEMNLDDLNDALLDKADKIQFSEDELAELERQEREKSIMTESEKDLRALERLESDLETAEKIMRASNLDEDKLLEGENLNNIEKNFNVKQQESLDELEENFGKRYLDEDLNDKENPYGLTEFDIEEIDELLNADQETSIDSNSSQEIIE
ncbi:MAG: hypothetical protein CME62_11295 [Halobacteriovoraceae bacterium]|nr:hypothetical protein [Halobacteriovoraceae bacterium]|tara:strand:+ start:14001 stop:16172 length:2172 start_codon:yes stop_codon:yes gene_type:complete